jgi:hypothetical protein
MSLAQSLLAILLNDTGGQAVTLLQNFQAGIDASPSAEGAIAAGMKFLADGTLALPTVEGSLLKDATDLLISDAISEITSAKTAAAVAATTPAPTAAPTT